MKGTVYSLIIAVSLLAVSAAEGLAVKWEPVGYGTLEDSSRFDVFVDIESVRTADGKIRFWQGHVFYEEQPLPTGKSFIRVTIGKTVDCASRSDSNVEAVFYGADGAVVDKYDSEGISRLKPVIPETISSAVLDYVCALGKKG